MIIEVLEVLLIVLGTMVVAALIFVVFRSLRLQQQAISKQDTALSGVDESIQMQREALELQKHGIQMVQESLEPHKQETQMLRETLAAARGGTNSCAISLTGSRTDKRDINGELACGWKDLHRSSA